MWFSPIIRLSGPLRCGCKRVLAWRQPLCDGARHDHDHAPEWAPQDWLWIGFPHLAEEWPGWLEPAQVQMAAFASAVADSGQQVRLLVRDEANEARARSLVSSKVTLERRVYGDVWLRDTGPLVVSDGAERTARRFGFNGWGGKYLMPGDQEIGAELARDAGLAVTHTPMILEGGAVDGDGTGLVATTEQCLLNPNRNPPLSREQIQQNWPRNWVSPACFGSAMVSSTTILMAMSITSRGSLEPTAWWCRRPRARTIPTPQSMPTPPSAPGPQGSKSSASPHPAC